ncbi:unnamed protein product [Effrenium voratum]|uniref:Uncharacterized protein n=1 Tax=Effrenium voratum TaxID=2562239 RepID=A0AA36IQK2_9DINO|nr:unnamed protein product [Effrenium voratum]
MEDSDSESEDATNESQHDEDESVDEAPMVSTKDSATASPEELRALAANCCTDGAQLLRKGEMEEAQQQLLRGQTLLERAEAASSVSSDKKAFAVLQAEIAGNLGICYRRAKDFDNAIQQLQLALQYHQVRLDAEKAAQLDAPDLRTLVAAHLNLASCHLESEAPGPALKHASMAAQISGQVLSRTGEAGTPEPTENDFAMLAVSFHKAAEAHEALKEWGKAIFAHTQAREVVQRSLGAAHPLAQSLARCQPRPNTGRSEFLENYAASIGRSTGCPLLRPGKGQKVLPTIPRGARGKPLTSVDFQLTGYQIQKVDFPSWPPESSSNEEKEWYAMARALRHEAPPLPKLAAKQEPVVDNFPAIPPPKGIRRSRPS